MLKLFDTKKIAESSKILCNCTALYKRRGAEKLFCSRRCREMRGKYLSSE
jgi:hypothetical protein